MREGTGVSGKAPGAKLEATRGTRGSKGGRHVKGMGWSSIGNLICVHLGMLFSLVPLAAGALGVLRAVAWKSAGNEDRK